MAYDSNKINAVYNTLVEGGADVGTQEEFTEWFTQSGAEGDQTRKSIYDAFKEGGEPVGNTYNEFYSWLLAPDNGGGASPAAGTGGKSSEKAELPAETASRQDEDRHMEERIKMEDARRMEEAIRNKAAADVEAKKKQYAEDYKRHHGFEPTERQLNDMIIREEENHIKALQQAEAERASRKEEAEAARAAQAEYEKALKLKNLEGRANLEKMRQSNPDMVAHDPLKKERDAVEVEYGDKLSPQAQAWVDRGKTQRPTMSAETQASSFKAVNQGEDPAFDTGIVTNRESSNYGHTVSGRKFAYQGEDPEDIYTLKEGVFNPGGTSASPYELNEVTVTAVGGRAVDKRVDEMRRLDPEAYKLAYADLYDKAKEDIQKEIAQADRRFEEWKRANLEKAREMSPEQLASKRNEFAQEVETERKLANYEQHSKAIQDEIIIRTKEIRAEVWEQCGGNQTTFLHIYPSACKADDTLQALELELRNLDKAKERAETKKRDEQNGTFENYMQGAGSKLFDIVTNPFGVTELRDTYTPLFNIKRKIDTNKPLTRAEERALESYYLKEDVESRTQMSGARAAGEFTTGLVECALEFGLNPASGVTRKTLMKIATEVGEDGVRMVLRNSPGLLMKLGYKAENIGARQLGKNIAKLGGAALAEGAAVTGTTQAAKNIGQVVDRSMYRKDEEGNYYQPESTVQAMAKVGVSSTATNAIFMVPANYGSKVVETLTKGKQATSALKDMHLPFGNPIDAFVKMKGGEVTSVLTGSTFGRSDMDPTWDSVFSASANGELITNLLVAELVSGGIKGAVSYAKGGYLKRNSKKQEEQARQAALRAGAVFSESRNAGEWNAIVGMFNSGDAEQFKAASERIEGNIRKGTFSKREGDAAVDYVKAAARYIGSENKYQEWKQRGRGETDEEGTGTSFRSQFTEAERKEVESYEPLHEGAYNEGWGVTDTEGAQELWRSYRLPEGKEEELGEWVNRIEERDDAAASLYLIEKENTLSEENKNILKEYILNKARWEGYADARDTRREEELSKSDRYIDERTNRDGNVQRVRRESDDSELYVVAGNLVTEYDEGSGRQVVNREKSSDVIFCYDPREGKVKTYQPGDLRYDLEAVSASAFKEYSRGEISKQHEEEDAIIRGEEAGAIEEGAAKAAAQNQASPEAGSQEKAGDGSRASGGNSFANGGGAAKEYPTMSAEDIGFHVDESFLVPTDGDGSKEQRAVVLGNDRRDIKVWTQHPISSLSERNHEFGGYNTMIPVGEIDSWAIKDSEGNYKDYVHPQKGRFNVEAEKPAAKAPEVGRQESAAEAPEAGSQEKAAEAPDAGSQEKAAEAAAQNQAKAEGAATALSRIPKNEKEVPLFTTVEPPLAWDGIVELAKGDEKEARVLVGSMWKDANDKYEKLRNQAPKEEKPNLKGKNILEKAQEMERVREVNKQRREQYEEALSEAKAEVDSWLAIGQEHTKLQQARMNAEADKRRAEEQARKEEAERQYQAQQAEKEARKAEAAKTGAHNVGAGLKERWEKAQKVVGPEGIYIMPDGTQLKGHWMLVEAGSVAASHDPENGFKKTEGFPVDKNGNTVNDRDYEADKDAQGIVMKISDGYDARAIQSPVVVSRDGVVLSGNNRTMSGDLAARKGTDTGYIDYLKNNDGMFKREEVEQFQHPRKVFVTTEELPYTAETFARFNQSETKSQNTAEKTIKQGKTVSDAAFRKIVNFASEHETIKEFFSDPKAAKAVIGILEEAGVINSNEKAQYFSNGRLSEEGELFIEKVLVGKSLENSPEAVRELMEMPTARRRFASALLQLADNKALKNGYDLGEEMVEAIDLVYRAKMSEEGSEKKVYGEGKPISPFGRQEGLFPEEFGEQSVKDATVLMLADLLNHSNLTELRKVLEAYNGAAREASNGSGDIFSGEPEKKEDILTRYINEFKNANKRQREQAEAEYAGRRAANAREERGEREESNTGGTEGVKEAENAYGRGGEGEDGRDEYKPIGTGIFGKIYDQFKGKVKEAFSFLLKHKEGDLRGVFHRDGIGDIDLVWGDAATNDGLAHIIDKHVGADRDFATVDDAMKTIDDVINNGRVIKERWDKLTIDKDGKRVVIRKNLRNEKGEIVDNNKNWVVTSFDSNTPKIKGASARATPSKPDVGAGAVAPNLSNAKVNEKKSEKQGNEGEKSLEEAKKARAAIEKGANDYGRRYRGSEGFSDYTRGLDKLEDSRLEEERGKLSQTIRDALKEASENEGKEAYNEALKRAGESAAQRQAVEAEMARRRGMADGGSVVDIAEDIAEVYGGSLFRDEDFDFMVVVPAHRQGNLFEDEWGAAPEAGSREAAAKAAAQKPEAGSQEGGGSRASGGNGFAPGRGATVIEDFGEKIAGARKDMLSEFAKGLGDVTEEALVKMPLGKAVKRPDFGKMTEKGAMTAAEATVAEALWQAVNLDRKPTAKRTNRVAIQQWAKRTAERLKRLESFLNGDAETRRSIIEKMNSEERFEPSPEIREHEQARYDDIREQNSHRRAFAEPVYTPDEAAVNAEILKRMGAQPGDKVKLGLSIHPNSSYEYYEIRDAGGNRLLYTESGRNLEQMIEKAVMLTRVMNGDMEVVYPKSCFSLIGMDPKMAPTGRWKVGYLAKNSWNYKERVYESRAEAEAGQKKLEERGCSTTLREEQERTGKYGSYKIRFTNPLNGERIELPGTYESREEARARIEEGAESVSEEVNRLIEKERSQTDIKRHFYASTTYQRGEGRKFVVAGEKPGSEGEPMVIKEFKSREEAEAWLESNTEALEEIRRKWVEGRKKFTFFESSEKPRQGKDLRGGKDVTPEQFTEDFGFRGVQFGNWTNGRDRQAALNEAYDSFHDLAEVLGVSPRALSLNGELGLSFGARGTGNANAHYEPMEVVINLTKTRGAGSLAHEWWHALDNYMMRQKGNPLLYATSHIDSRSGHRAEVVNAFRGLTEAVNKSAYAERSKRRRNADYWGSDIEMTARLFGEWVVDELGARGASNHFLSRGIEPEVFDRYRRFYYEAYKETCGLSGEKPMSFEEFSKQGDSLRDFPYPTVEETRTLGKHLRRIFDSLEERGGEKGGIMLEDDEAGYGKGNERNAKSLRNGTVEEGGELFEKRGMKARQLSLFDSDFGEAKREGLLKDERSESLIKAEDAVVRLTDDYGEAYSQVLRAPEGELPSALEEYRYQLRDELWDSLRHYYREKGNSAEEAEIRARETLSNIEAQISLAEWRRAEAAPEAGAGSRASGGNGFATGEGEYKTAGGARLLFEHDGWLPELGEGEFCHFEQKFQEEGKFSFSGDSRIESADDVAYMLRSLEEYSREHSFAVMEKDGVPVVVHLGMGTMAGTMVDLSAVKAADLMLGGADRVWFVHNHPSGNLRCSGADCKVHENLAQMLGDRLGGSIIIDTLRGEYGMFDSQRSTGEYKRPTSARSEETPVGVYSYDRFEQRVYDADFDFSQLAKVDGPQSVASFMSGYRLGDGKKAGVLVLNHANRIVANLPVSHLLTSEEGIETIVKYAVRGGGDRVILFTNNRVSVGDLARLRDGIKSHSGGSLSLLDVVMGKDGYSAHDNNLFRMGESKEDFDGIREEAVEKRGIVMPGLAEKEVRVVRVARHDFEGDRIIEQARKWAKENIVGEHELTDSAGKRVKYKISGRTIHKYLSDSAIGKSDNLGVHVAVLKELPEVISESIEAEVHPDYNKVGERGEENGNDDRYLIHRFYGAVDIEGERYRVKTTVKENGEGKEPTIPHSFEVTEIELLPESNSSEVEPTAVNSESRSPHRSPKLTNKIETDKISGRKLLEGVEKSYDPGVKLLEASEKNTSSGSGSQHNERTAGMKQRAQEIGERLNTPLRIITRAEAEEQGLGDKKGWTNRRTGEVTIVAENHRNEGDIADTVVHEVVGHHGLRALYGGEEQLHEFLDSAYRKSSRKIRSDIEARAAEMMERDIRRLAEERGNGYFGEAEARVEVESNRARYLRDATEEYASDLGMRMGEEGLEKIREEELTFWARMRGGLQRGLNKIFESLGFDPLFRWSDREWGYLLSKSRENLRNRELGPDVFEAAEDYLLRERSGYGKGKGFSDAKELMSRELFREGDEEKDPEALRTEMQTRLASLLTRAAQEMAEKYKGSYKRVNEVRQRLGTQLNLVSKILNEREGEGIEHELSQQTKETLSEGAEESMAAQREHDLTSYRALSDMVELFSAGGGLDSVTAGEVRRLLNACGQSIGAGRRKFAAQASRVMNILIGNHLRQSRETFYNLLKIKDSKVNAFGVEVQGRLDSMGQKTIKTLRENYGKRETNFEEEIKSLRSRLEQARGETAKGEIEAQIAGLEYAKAYRDTVNTFEREKESVKGEMATLKKEYESGMWTEREYYANRGKLLDKLQKTKIEHADAYRVFVNRLAGDLKESAEGALHFRDSQKEQSNHIRHLANSDMKGLSAESQRSEELRNNFFKKALTRPLGSFEAFMKLFSRGSMDGHGMLEQEFIPRLNEASGREYLGIRGKQAKLGEKVVEIFSSPIDKREAPEAAAEAASQNQAGGITGSRASGGNGFATEGEESGKAKLKEGKASRKREERLRKEWVRLGRKARKENLTNGKRTVKIAFRNGDTEREYELGVGELMYIYAAGKSIDGSIKLHRMGITDEKLQQIKELIPKDMRELTDWVQEEFLTDCREEYNRVHERMFGAPMAANEHYIPLKIDKNSIPKDEDINNPVGGRTTSSVSTGAVIKRTFNSLPLDILHTNFFDVINDHIREMEHWAAYSEVTRDLNTLVSHNRFKNQVKGMKSVLGNGEELWDSFVASCRVATGNYDKVKNDKWILDFSSAMIASKVAGRLYTAFKQLSSFPAYIGEANIGHLALSALRLQNSFEWARQNLPQFEKRWGGRMAGDEKLESAARDGKWFKKYLNSKIAKGGMWANAFVDACTVAMGAKAIYETKLKRYESQGYSKADAEAKAKADASNLYNKTQQSSEGAYLSEMQAERTFLSTLFTAYRNSPISYQRMLVESARNIKRRMKGNAEDMIRQRQQQILREWGYDLENKSGVYEKRDFEKSEAMAWAAAKRDYKTSWKRDILNLAIFGFTMQLTWNLFGHLPYISFGSDNDERWDMGKDDAWHALIGGQVEGLTGGDILSDGLNNLRNIIFSDDDWNTELGKQHPLFQDLSRLSDSFKYDWMTGANEILNILVASNIGAAPTTLTDAVVAISDFLEGDMSTAKEWGFLMMRIAQVPQSQLEKIWLDELDCTGAEAKRLSPVESARRYARYKVMKGYEFTHWFMSEDDGSYFSGAVGKKQEKMRKQFKERLDKLWSAEENKKFATLSGEMEEIGKKEKSLNERLDLLEDEAAGKELDSLYANPKYEKYEYYKLMNPVLKGLADAYLDSRTPEEAERQLGELVKVKGLMIERLGGGAIGDSGWEEGEVIAGRFEEGKRERKKKALTK